MHKDAHTITTIAASGPQAESSGILVLQIAEPFRRNERDDTDDRVAYGEDTPQHADRLGIANVIGRVHVRGLDVLDLGAHLGVVAKSIVELAVNANSMSRPRPVVEKRSFFLVKSFNR